MEPSVDSAPVAPSDEVDLLWLRESDLTLLDELGSGSEGVAFKATLVGKAGLVCAKANITLFNPIYGIVHGSPAYHYALSELRKEARMLASLAHLNVLEYIGITMGTDGFPKHIVTELATSTLDKYWEGRPGSLTLEVLLHMCEDLFSGLEYLHTRKPQSVIHCDIKPDNIFVFVSESGVRVKLGDLGLARYTSSTKAVGKADGGNARYRAPEVDEGDFTGKADVFSIGLVIAELVLQHVPIPNFTRIAYPFGLFESRGNRNIHHIRGIVISEGIHRLRSIHPPLAALLESCCSPDPDTRYSSSEALDAIQGLLGVLSPVGLGSGEADFNALLVPSVDPVNFRDETVNKAVYARELSERVSNEVVTRLQSRGHSSLREASRAWRSAFDKLARVRVHNGSALTFGRRLQGFGALLAWRSKSVAGADPPPALSDAIAAVRGATTILQNLSGKEYLKKLVSSRESVEGLAPPDDALISSVKGAFAEASLPALSFQRVAYEEMRDRNSVVLAQLEALGGYETVKGNRHALESVLTSVCESKEILRSVVAAQLCCEYEDRVGVVPEASPASVLYHSTLRSLWHATFPAEDEVSVVDFLAALKEFVSSVVLLSADDVETMFHVGGKAALQNNICFAYPANNRVSLTKLRDAVSPDVEFVAALQSLIAQGSASAFVSEPPPMPFIGYVSQLEAVHTAVTWSSIAARQHVVTVGGPSGCGLTSFLRRVAVIARDRGSFPGGVYLIDLQGTLDVDAGLSTVCARIGVRVSERAVPALRAWARWLTSPTLLLIDGGDCALSKWKGVYDAIASENGMLKVAVGCSGDDLGEVPKVSLNGLSLPDVSFLIQFTGGDELGAEEEAKIVTASRCLPGLAWWLCRQSASLIGASPGPSAAILDVGNLSVEAQRLLDRMFVFPATFDVSAAEAVAANAVAMPGSVADRKSVVVELLGELDVAGFVQKRSDGRYYVSKGVPRVAVSDALLAAFVKHFVGVLGRAGMLYDSSAVLAGLSLFDLERDNLNALFDLCEHAVEQSHCVQVELSQVSSLYLIHAKLDLARREGIWRGLLQLARSSSLSEPRSNWCGGCLIALANVLESQGKLEEAMGLQQEALEIHSTELGPNHPNVAASLSNIGNLLETQGMYAEAWKYYEKAMEVIRAVTNTPAGSLHVDMVGYFSNSANALDHLGRHQEALERYKICLRVKVDVRGARHPEVAAVMNNIGRTYESLSLYDLAAEMHRNALGIRRETLPPQHPDIALSMKNLGQVLLKLGKHSEALALHQEVLDRHTVVLGSQHPDVAYAKLSIAAVYERQGRYLEAMALYTEALRVLKLSLGPSHPDIAVALNNFACVLEHLAKYEEALVMHTDALEIKKAVHQSDHRLIASSMTNIANVLQHLERRDEALAMHEEALGLLENAVGTRHREVAASHLNIGNVLKSQEKYSEALVRYREAHAILRDVVGPDHVDVAKVLSNIAVILDQLEKYGEALAMNRNALDIRKRGLGPDHVDVASSLNNIASSLAQAGRCTEARPLLLNALRIFRSTLGPDHPTVKLVEGNLSNLASRSSAAAHSYGNLPERISCQRRSTDIALFDFGGESVLSAPFLCDLASLLSLRGDFEEALRVYQQLLGILEATCGPMHLSVLVLRMTMADVMVQQERLGEASSLYNTVLDDLRATVGPAHHSVALCISRIGEVLRLQGDAGEALSKQLEALSLRKGRFGDNHMIVAFSMSSIGRAMSANNDLIDEALELHQGALRILKSRPGLTSSLLAAKTLASIGCLLIKRDALACDISLDGAMKCSQAIQTLKSTLGERHPDVAQLSIDLAEAIADASQLNHAVQAGTVILENFKDVLAPTHPVMVRASHLVTWILALPFASSR